MKFLTVNTTSVSGYDPTESPSRIVPASAAGLRPGAPRLRCVGMGRLPAERDPVPLEETPVVDPHASLRRVSHGRWTGRSAWRRAVRSDWEVDRLAPLIGLALVLIAAAALLLHETHDQSLFADEWGFFLLRSHGPVETLFAPNQGSLALVPLLVYRTVFKFLGPDITVLRIILVGLELLCAGLFFELTRRRVGDWIALGAATLLLFLGSSWLLVSTVGITLYVAVALGLAALIAIERRDLRGDVVACALLILAVASYSVALSFLAGAVIAICLRPARLRLRRAWVVAIPLVLYGIWRIWADDYAQHPTIPVAQTVIDPAAITKAPAFIGKGFADGLASASGLFRLGPQHRFYVDHSWGVPLAVLLFAAALARFLWPRRPPIDREAWVFLAMPVVFWTALSVASLGFAGIVVARNPNAAGYQYASVLLLLLAAAALAKGLEIRRPARLALAAILFASLVPNVLTLREAAGVFRAHGLIDQAELAAVELVGSRAARIPIETPQTAPNRTNIVPDLGMRPEDYLPVAAVRGSAAAPVSSLRSTTPAARKAADLTLIRLYQLAPRPSHAVTPGPSSAQVPSLERGAANLRRSRGGCLNVRPRTAGAPLSFKVALGGLALQADKGPSVALRLRRFTDPPGLPAGSLAGGTRATLAIPTDASDHPWRLLISPSQAVRLCGLPNTAAPMRHGTRAHG